MSYSAGGKPEVRDDGLTGSRKRDDRLVDIGDVGLGVEGRTEDRSAASLLRLEVLCSPISDWRVGVKKRFGAGSVCTGDATVLPIGDNMLVLLGAPWRRSGVFKLRIFVTLPSECSNPSNSTSRYDGLRGTCPITYGRPLSVAAGFQCFREDVPNSDGMRLRLVPDSRSCCLYSSGTNSSNSISVVPVRGSVVPDTVPSFVTGSDLNSTCADLDSLR